MSNYQGRLSTRQLTIFIYFYSHWHFFNIFVTVWQPWAIISLRQNSGHTVTLKISYSSTENQKKISKLKICLAGPSDPSETISSDLIKVCCLSMSNFSNVNNSPFRQVERNCVGLVGCAKKPVKKQRPSDYSRRNFGLKFVAASEFGASRRRSFNTNEVLECLKM